ncbi:PilW family protein [Aromatoleum petrolei]|uniref:Type IV pilus assembly protein PilW n=1 Tax=Aromatoleum petrolei TaxID=76116 RepID=A0ABX1MLT7_9RHOO|nr:PilW family protein [Aromatoleum petrolei]NMF88924.1 hypothetical protein [Aromatoleum petrolei]
MFRFVPSHPFGRTQAGVSLVEVMISMTLGLLVLAAMTTVFVNNSQSRRELNNAATQLENGRYALQILKDELSMAGYYDALANLNTGAKTASPCSSTVADWSDTMVVAVEGVNSDRFDCINSASVKANTGMIFVQRASTSEQSPEALDNTDQGRAFLQVQMCGAQYDAGNRMVLKSHTEQDPDTVFTMQTKKCDGTKAPIREYIRRIFFIGEAKGIPVLRRVDVRSDGLQAAQDLVEGIEDLQFEYAIDTNSNGSPDEFSETPTADKMADIVGVRVWLIARSLLPTPGYSESKTFKLGTKDAGAIAGLLPAGYKRHVFTTYIELVHPVARREK